MPAHELGANSSAAGWCAACPCGWRSDTWHRAKNSAMRESRDHVRGESAAAGARARGAHPPLDASRDYKAGWYDGKRA